MLGVTNETGTKIVDPGWSQKRSIYPEDVLLSIYSAMGVDWTKKVTQTPSGRPFEYIENISPIGYMRFSELANYSPKWAYKKPCMIGPDSNLSSSLTSPAAVVKRTLRFCRHAATHSPVSKCVLPVPHSPMNRTGSLPTKQVTFHAAKTPRLKTS